MQVRVVQQLVNGLSIGSTYALLAVGYSLIHSVLQFSNFAHASFLLVGAYAAFFLVTAASFPFVYGVVLGSVIAAVAAAMVEGVAYRPIRRRRGATLYFIIASMGVAIFCQHTIIATIGPRPRNYPRVLSISSLRLGPITISVLDVLGAALTVVLLCILHWVLSRTKVGFAIQAAAFDVEAAGLMGVNVDRLISLVFLIAGVLAGISGVLLGMKYTVNPQLGNLTTKAFVGATFGGLGSLPGAILGSVVLGVMEAFVAGFISSELRDLFVFALLIAVLLVRPRGMMGKHIEVKV